MIEAALAIVGCVGVADVAFFGGRIGVKVASALKLSGAFASLLAKVKAKL